MKRIVGVALAFVAVGCRSDPPSEAAPLAEVAAPLVEDGKADGVFGQPNLLTGTVPVSVTSATTTHPTGVATDGVQRNPGYLLVIDREASRGLLLTTFSGSWSLNALYGQSSVNNGLPNQGLLNPSPSTLHTPTAAAFVSVLSEVPGSQNWAAVADTANHRVVVSNNFFGSFFATMVVGQSGDFTTGVASKGGVHADSLDEPSGVAWDPNTVPARLYVADTGHHRILRFDTLLGGTAPGASAVFGQDTFSDSAPNAGLGKASARGLSRPTGLAGWFLPSNVGDPLRGLWVADSGNHRVVHLSSSGLADFVIGQPDFVSNAPNAFGLSARSLRAPSAVAVDPRGRVWVADTGNHRVLRFPKGATVADVVLGQPSFEAVAPPTTTSERTLFLPSGVAVGGNGDLYVADTGASRILRFSVSCADPKACDDGDPCTDDTCDPTFHCQHVVTTNSRECAPYVCAFPQRRCNTSCDASHPCAPGRSCVSGRCLVLCAIHAQCAAFGGWCSDGVCCDAACDGVCESCRVLGREGQCTVVPAGSAPTAPKACPGGSTGCSRACDGVHRGSCRFDAAGTTCGIASCEDGVETGLGRCDGEGRCDAPSKACAPYACAPAACRAQCDYDHDCAPGLACVDRVCTTTRSRGGGCGLARVGETSTAVLLLLAVAALGRRRR